VYPNCIKSLSISIVTLTLGSIRFLHCLSLGARSLALNKFKDLSTLIKNIILSTQLVNIKETTLNLPFRMSFIFSKLKGMKNNYL